MWGNRSLPRCLRHKGYKPDAGRHFSPFQTPCLQRCYFTRELLTLNLFWDLWQLRSVMIKLLASLPSILGILPWPQIHMFVPPSHNTKPTKQLMRYLLELALLLQEYGSPRSSTDLDSCLAPSRTMPPAALSYTWAEEDTLGLKRFRTEETDAVQLHMWASNYR